MNCPAWINTDRFETNSPVPGRTCPPEVATGLEGNRWHRTGGPASDSHVRHNRPSDLRWFAFAGLLLGTSLAFSGCSPKTNAMQEAPASREAVEQNSPAPAIAIEPAQSRPGWTLKLNGRLTWDDNVTTRMFSPFAGRVARILVETGQKVHKGDPLALIDSPDYGVAQAERAKAGSDFALADKNLQRVQELYENGAAPAKDLALAEAEFARTKSELQRTTQKLALYGDTDEIIDQHYTLRSPIDGVVVEKNLNPGQEVRPDQMLAGTPQLSAPLFVITDPEHLWVLVDASEREMQYVSPSQSVQLRVAAFGDERFPGKIEHVSDALDPASRTIRIRGGVANPARHLKSEMLATVELPVLREGVVEVPSRSVFLEHDRHHVVIEESPGKFVKREVHIGPETGGKTLVVQGLKSGERVVADGAILVSQSIESGKEG